VTERYRRVNYGTVVIDMTIDGPGEHCCGEQRRILGLDRTMCPEVRNCTRQSF